VLLAGRMPAEERGGACARAPLAGWPAAVGQSYTRPNYYRFPAENAPLTITILYFASLREAVGIDSEQFAPPPGVVTAGQLRAWLRERGSPWAEALGEGRAVRVAVNKLMAHDDATVPDGAEVAFFPPVTGG